MSSVLLCCTPAHSHLTPILTVARHLVAAHHDVRVLTGCRFADLVTDTGAEFLPLPAEADIDLDHPNEAFPERAGLRGPAEIRFSMINLFIRPGRAQLRAIDDAIQVRPVDVVVAEALFTGAVLLHGRPRNERPAVFTLGIVPLAAEDPDVAPYGLGMTPMPGTAGRVRNAILRGVAGRIFGPVNAAVMDSYRAIGVAEPADFSLFDVPANTDLVLQFTVPGFEYPRSTLPENVRFAGPLSRLTTAAGEPVPGWWRDLDAGRPVVHVTQGTVANADLGELVIPTIQALAADDVLVVVSTGRGNADALDDLSGGLPDNVRVADYLPYGPLFDKLSVLVTNGGYGGLHHALQHGVPIVAAGATEDKLETTARVAWSGAGINLRTSTPSPTRIRAAVGKVLSDSRYRKASARIGAEIASAPGLAALDEAIAELPEPVTE